MLHVIMCGCLFAILYAVLQEANVSAGFTAISMGGAFISAIIYGLIKEA